MGEVIKPMDKKKVLVKVRGGGGRRGEGGRGGRGGNEMKRKVI